MDIAAVASSAVSTKSALNKLQLNNGLLKQRNDAEQAVVQILQESQDRTAQINRSGPGRFVDISV
ncbi:MAG: hypothetical protein ACPGO3_07780 [Magnetospiraceae bacterium]